LTNSAQAAVLIGRLPTAGMLALSQKKDPAGQFRFGREADGILIAPRDWEDLDLWLAPGRRDRPHRRSMSMELMQGSASQATLPDPADRLSLTRP